MFKNLQTLAVALRPTKTYRKEISMKLSKPALGAFVLTLLVAATVGTPTRPRNTTIPT